MRAFPCLPLPRWSAPHRAWPIVVAAPFDALPAAIAAGCGAAERFHPPPRADIPHAAAGRDMNRPAP